MTRRQLIEMVQNRLVHYNVGVDTTEVITPQMIGAYLEIAYSTVLNTIIKQNKSRNGFSELNSYGQTYRDLDVQEDQNRNQKYVQLPVEPIDLMDQMAIRLVAPNGSQKSFFVARRPGAHNAMMQFLDVDKREDGVYYLEKDRIYFEKIDSDLEKMQVVMIPSLRGRGIDDEIKLPETGETNVLDMCYQMLVSKYNLPADNVNDQTQV